MNKIQKSITVCLPIGEGKEISVPIELNITCIPEDIIAKALLHKNNKSGYPGVRWWEARKKWVAQAWVDGKRKTLGTFNTKEEAYAAYLKAKGLQL